MKKIAVLLLLAAVLSVAPAHASVKLPTPDRSGGMSLIEALAARRSERDFADVDLTETELSTLLWATGGVNRPDGKKTYPTSMGRDDMTVYVVNRDGAFKYVSERNELELVAAGDHRGATGMQPFAASSAVDLVYVQDTKLWSDAPADQVAATGFAHASSMSQNCYLFAASRGWSCVVRGSFDGDRLAKLLKLDQGQVVRLVQSVGPARVASSVPGRRLGGLTPQDALEYMKSTKRLLIVDVRSANYRTRNRFFGSIVISAGDVGRETADRLLMSLPADRPVIFHCGNGVAARRVYDRLLKLRSDVREVSYIDGRPLFEEYEKWRSAR